MVDFLFFKPKYMAISVIHNIKNTFTMSLILTVVEKYIIGNLLETTKKYFRKNTVLRVVLP